MIDCLPQMFGNLFVPLIDKNKFAFWLVFVVNDVVMEIEVLAMRHVSQGFIHWMIYAHFVRSSRDSQNLLFTNRVRSLLTEIHEVLILKVINKANNTMVQTRVINSYLISKKLNLMNEQIRLANNSNIHFLVASLTNTLHNYFSILSEDPFWWVEPVVLLKPIEDLTLIVRILKAILPF